MSQIDHVMQRVGRIVAADQQLQVDVRGVLAYAEPGRVVIPSIDHYEWLGKKHSERMLHGLLDHECAHALDTDFDVVKEASKAGPAFKVLVNALEDGYIEARQGRRYLGAGQNLTAKNRWFWELSGGDYISAPERIKNAPDPWSAFCLAATMVVRVHGGVSVSDIEAINPGVHAMLAAVEPELRAVVALADRPKASKEVFEIAKSIYDRFVALAKNSSPADDHAGEGGGSEEEGESQKGRDHGGMAKSAAKAAKGTPRGDSEEEGGDEEAGTGGEDSPASETDEGGGGESSEDPHGADGSGDTDGVEGDDSTGDDRSPSGEPSGGLPQDPRGRRDGDAGDGDGGPEARRDPLKGEFRMDLTRWTPPPNFVFNPEDEITRVVKSVFEARGKTQPYTVFSNEFDLERDFSSEDLRARSEAWDDAVEDARLAADSLVLAFEHALRAKRDKRPVGGYDEGEVDVTLLAEYGVGACPVDRLYQQYVAEDDGDVAVSILLDCSGSMGQGARAPSRLARQAAIAMHLALAQCQLAHEITGFTTAHSGSDDHPWEKGVERAVVENFARMRAALVEAQAHGTNLSKFAREVFDVRDVREDGGLCVPSYAVFKSFDHADARGLMEVTGIANNLDGEAVLWQARRLARRPEPRRVMFVLSDGAPAGSHDNYQGATYLKDVVERVVASGIEVYGIGMRSEAVRQFYPIWWLCHDMDDLAALAVESLIDVLTRSRQERRWVDVA